MRSESCLATQGSPLCLFLFKSVPLLGTYVQGLLGLMVEPQQQCQKHDR